MTKDFLTSLPGHLASVVVCEWLSLASIARLDSSYCNQKLRRELLNLLRSVEFIHTHYTGLEDPIMLTWLILRQAHVQSVVVDFRRDVLVADEYLKFGGPCIQNIELRILASAQCKNLRYLTHKISHFNDSLWLSLRNNPTLLELRLDQILYHPPPWEPKHSLALPHLQLLSLRNSRCTEKLVVKLVGGAPNLRVIDVFRTYDVTARVLLWLARRCPLQTSHGLGHLNLEDATITQLCTLCQNLLHLDLCHNVRLSDRGLQSISEHLHCLKSFNIEGCARLTEQSLVHLTELKESIECLYVDAAFLRSDAILAWCLTQCAKCTTFSISQRAYHNSYDSPSTVLLSSLANIVTLSLCEVNVTDVTLCEIGLHCQKLQHLSLYHTVHFHPEFTRVGLTVLMQCVELKLLLVPKTKFYDPFEDQGLFKGLRPGLKMISSIDDTIFEYTVHKYRVV